MDKLPVDILFFCFRDVIIDHQLDMMNIHSPSQQVRGNEGRNCPVPEVFQIVIPVTLLHRACLKIQIKWSHSVNAVIKSLKL